MKAKILLIVFIALGLVHNIECDVMSSFIYELKKWSDYFGITEDSNLFKNNINEYNGEESHELHHFPDEEKISNLDTELQPTFGEGPSKLTKELYEEEKYEESTDHKEVNDLFVKTDKISANDKLDQEVSSQNLNFKSKIDPENQVEIPPLLQDESKQNENVESATSIESIDYTVFENTSENENEILIYEDMVKIEFKEQEPNTQEGIIEGDTDIENLNKNNVKDHNMFSNEAANDKVIQNVISIENNEDFHQPLPQAVNNISPSKENQIPQKSFVEPPMADDEDFINTLSLFSKCNNAEGSLSCIKEDSVNKEEESFYESKTILVKTSTEVESHSDVCSLCSETPSPNKWDSYEIQYESNENEHQ